MKRAAMLSLVLLLLCGGILVYALINTQLDVHPLPPQVLSASEHQNEFQRLQKAVSNRSLIGTSFTQDVPGDADDYNIIIYTVTLSNRGLLPAQMAELSVSPSDNDMLYYTDGSTQGEIPDISVPAGGSATIRCALLTRSNSRQSTVRDLFISYYIWGNPFTIRITAGT